MIYDSSKHYITQSEIINSSLSISSFMATRKLLSSFSDRLKSINEKYVKNSNQIVDMTMLPVF
jgi:hypothetical protein